MVFRPLPRQPGQHSLSVGPLSLSHIEIQAARMSAPEAQSDE
jgi:hypothetical protein